jgi:hypothetical protein
MAIADQLEKLRGQESDRFRAIEPKSARKALLGKEARAVENEFVDVAGRQMHRARALRIGLRASPLSSKRVVTQERGELGETRVQRS